MRFSAVAVSMFAGAAMAATSTDYVTEEVTITSCAATVTNCPARSTQVSTTVYLRTSSTEAAPSSVTPAGQPSNSGPVASGPASSAPVASSPASSAPVASAPAPSGSANACAATCATEYNTCRSAPDANRASCASSYASCLGYSPYDSNGSLITPTACSSGASATSAPASSAPVASAPAPSGSANACAATCTTEYNTCRSAPDANRASCASSYASCLGYSPYDSNGSLITPTACSSGASATSAPASSAPVASAPAPSGSANACAATCTTEYNTCRSAPDANRASCASSYASCLGYSPYDSNGSLITPTACSSGASATSAPASSAPASSKPASFTPTYATPAASSAGSSLGVVVSSPAPSVSVVAITTCIPTVIYSTISLSGHETTAPGVPAASAKPSTTGHISVPANGTTPAATQTPLTFTGAAANLQVGGAAIAAVFGLAAFLL
ncbi:uncharacterized protein EAF02_007104 [Botrytis sinoallii]|uniref:uncharacterized protein n=1 Tax=Botrytis sinoallii TaxID=1463999 RepID=UPI00190149C4|nr:uncharacterized protein EAF02_007104 [Botrytis sinoallii]KAF7881213.1 hypothetical protein EAF02_007104 [Botrytis sinoallii]